MGPRKKAKIRRNRAARMLAQGMSQRATARELGVTQSTIRRWTDPEYAARDIENSRKAKLKRGGTCVDCGGPTQYSNYQPGKVSLRCLACSTKMFVARNREQARRNTKWTDEVILAAIHRWVAEHGSTPKMEQWAPHVKPDWAPHGVTVVRRFGTWNQAISAAGYVPRRRGGAAHHNGLPTDPVREPGKPQEGVRQFAA
jgi:hypothetical protein